jgi:hypothetical protein
MEKDLIKVIIGGAYFYYQPKSQLLYTSVEGIEGTTNSDSLNKYQKLELQNQIDSYNETNNLKVGR